MRIATLLDKPDRRLRPVDVKYVGFHIPDEFVVGYGSITRRTIAIFQTFAC